MKKKIFTFTWMVALSVGLVATTRQLVKQEQKNDLDNTTQLTISEDNLAPEIIQIEEYEYDIVPSLYYQKEDIEPITCIYNVEQEKAILRNQEIQEYIVELENKIEEEKTLQQYYAQAETTYNTYDNSSSYESYYTEGVLTKQGGVNYYNGYQKETYYNLDMSRVVANAQNMGIEGEYWVREDGVKMYGEYVIIATNLDTHPRGTVVETSLGDGIVLDTGGFAENNPDQVDIAVDW